MYRLPPLGRTVTANFPSLFNDHFVREFFDTDFMPELRVDLQKTASAYLLEADLPGVKKEDINLNVENGVLTISADLNQQKKEEKKGYVCSERRSGHVSRSFDLEGIDIPSITADYNNGVLMINLPVQKEDEKPNSMKIDIGSTQKNLEEGK